ncbi:MAG: hypothetical protein AAF226_13405, partial [Verrucomicrobiota bacterium]
MKSKLVKFLLGLALLLFLTEWIVRANAPYFHALSDRMLLKAKILERAPETKVLFLGTSRFLDGINHLQFSDELEELTGEEWKSLNGATGGLTGDRITHFAKLALDHPGLTHVIVEASPPAMSDSRFGIPTESSTPETQPKSERFADRFEHRLQDSVSNHIATVKYRKALRPQQFSKLFVLYTADLMDPNIWSRKRALQQLLLPTNLDIPSGVVEKTQ